jgi:hypothetical protein
VRLGLREPALHFLLDGTIGRELLNALVDERRDLRQRLAWRRGGGQQEEAADFT